MVKIQPCRNNCKKLIVVQEHEGKWKPFEVDSEGNVLDLHNCPNSEYNKQQQNKTGTTTGFKAQSGPTTTTSIPINNPTLEAVILNQISQKLDLMKKQMEEAIEQKLNEIMEYCKNNNLMGDAMIAHFGITQPTTAAELYQRQQNPQQGEEQKVYGWNSVPNPTDIDKQMEAQEDKELEDQGI